VRICTAEDVEDATEEGGGETRTNTEERRKERFTEEGWEAEMRRGGCVAAG